MNTLPEFAPQPLHECPETKGPLLVEGGYTVRTINDERGLMEAYRLRYAVFSRELGWAKSSETSLDVDHHDSAALSIGLYDCNDGLAACLRVITRPFDFMLDDEFSTLVSNRDLIRNDADTAEVSRFCMAPDARNHTVGVGGGQRNLSILLAKGLYQWCLKHGVRYVYAVSEEKAWRYYRSLGLPLVRIGGPSRMPDGVQSGAFILDWREFEGFNNRTSPSLMEWYSVQLDETGS